MKQCIRKVRILNFLVSFLKKQETLHFTAYILFFSFTIAPFLCSLSLILFCFSSVFHVKRKLFRKDNVVVLFLFFVPVLLYLIGYLYSPNKDRAAVLVVRILPVFIVPFCIVGTNIFKTILFSKLKIAFISGLLVSIFLSVSAAFYSFYLTHELSSFLYYKLGGFLHIHPTYYSLFVLTGIVFLSQKGFNIGTKKRFVLLLAFTIFILLLQSKVAIIVVLCYYFYLLLVGGNNAVGNKILVFIFLILASLFTGLQIGTSRLGDIQSNAKDSSIGSVHENGISQRIWLWQNALMFAKEKPIFGYGLGSHDNLFSWQIEKVLLNSNGSSSYNRAAKKIATLNCHNQYIQFIYELGFFGFFWFITAQIILVFKAIRYDNSLLILSITSYCLFLFTENLFDRQLGVYYYSVIIPFLYFAISED